MDILSGVVGGGLGYVVVEVLNRNLESKLIGEFMGGVVIGGVGVCGNGMIEGGCI